MGSLQVEKRNAEKFVQQSSEQHLTKNGTHTKDWKEVCLKSIGDSGFQHKGHPYPHPREVRNLN